MSSCRSGRARLAPVRRPLVRAHNAKIALQRLLCNCFFAIYLHRCFASCSQLRPRDDLPVRHREPAVRASPPTARHAAADAARARPGCARPLPRASPANADCEHARLPTCCPTTRDRRRRRSSRAMRWSSRRSNPASRAQAFSRRPASGSPPLLRCTRSYRSSHASSPGKQRVPERARVVDVARGDDSAGLRHAPHLAQHGHRVGDVLEGLVGVHDVEACRRRTAARRRRRPRTRGSGARARRSRVAMTSAAASSPTTRPGATRSANSTVIVPGPQPTSSSDQPRREVRRRGRRRSSRSCARCATCSTLSWWPWV